MGNGVNSHRNHQDKRSTMSAAERRALDRLSQERTRTKSTRIKKLFIGREITESSRHDIDNAIELERKAPPSIPGIVYMPIPSRIVEKHGAASKDIILRAIIKASRLDPDVAEATIENMETDGFSFRDRLGKLNSILGVRVRDRSSNRALQHPLRNELLALSSWSGHDSGFIQALQNPDTNHGRTPPFFASVCEINTANGAEHVSKYLRIGLLPVTICLGPLEILG